MAKVVGPPSSNLFLFPRPMILKIVETVPFFVIQHTEMIIFPRYYWKVRFY